MKYTKKMKLVDIDEIPLEQNNIATTMSDSNYASPRVLSSLDNIMSGVLNRNDLDDTDKWILYNQSLHRYLNFIKNQNQQQSIAKNHNQQPNNNDFEYTPSLFKPAHSQFEISGVETLRDSLDSISQPIVREFFEKVRNNGCGESSPNRSLNSSAMDIAEDCDLDIAQLRGNRRNQAKPPKKKRNTGSYGRNQRQSPVRTRGKAKRQNESVFKPARAVKVLIPRWTPTAAI